MLLAGIFCWILSGISAVFLSENYSYMKWILLIFAFILLILLQVVGK